ncbi:unnamed protein product [Caenorhabditis nigoni]
MKVGLLILLQFVSTSTLAHPTSFDVKQVVALGKELDKIQLTAKPSIKLTSRLEDVAVKAGTSITLRCESLSTPSANFQWEKDGEVIQGSLDINVEEKMLNIGQSVVNSGIVTSTYTIECPTEEDTGVYSCVASNGHDTVQSMATVEIEGETSECRRNHRSAPKIVQYTDSRFEMQGNIVTLSCRADRKAMWAWTYEEERLPEDGRFEILRNGDLRIRDIEWSDMGTYQCIAANKHGESTQDVFLYPTKKV